VRGFHAQHPKVAWAYEGLGRLHEKTGNAPAALDGYERAANILRSLQTHANGKELFQKELNALETKLCHLRRANDPSSP